MRLKSANIVKLAAFVAALTALSLGQSPAVRAGSLSFLPSDSDIMFRRYRGEDEVADHDDDRGRGRGRGRGGEGSESNNSGGQSDHSNSRSGNSPGSNANSKSDGSDRHDLDDRFGK